MNQVSLFRLYALRATYLLIFVGLAVEQWPLFLHRDHPWTLMGGVVHCMLAAMSVLALLGLRYPLQMLPLLLFELVWKAIWLLVVATPMWSAGQMDAYTWDTAVACLMGVIFPIVIPWPYVAANYLAKPSERWA